MKFRMLLYYVVLVMVWSSIFGDMILFLKFTDDIQFVVSTSLGGSFVDCVVAPWVSRL